jgi:hypothetical protein
VIEERMMAEQFGKAHDAYRQRTKKLISFIQQVPSPRRHPSAIMVSPYVPPWLAACALRRGLRIVTRNAREFARIGGLGIEDWRG